MVDRNFSDDDTDTVVTVPIAMALSPVPAVYMPLVHPDARVSGTNTDNDEYIGINNRVYGAQTAPAGAEMLRSGDLGDRDGESATNAPQDWVNCILGSLPIQVADDVHGQCYFFF